MPSQFVHLASDAVTRPANTNCQAADHIYVLLAIGAIIDRLEAPLALLETETRRPEGVD
jgi:hypothetical protein